MPTPEQFLGYPIGSRYTRHDQLVAYFQELAKRSDKISVREIGRSYEGRPLLIATVTAAGNHARLEQIRQQHATLADPAQPRSAAGDSPVVVWLGYSVHGNETSSAEAAMLTAYYLVANRSAEPSNGCSRQWCCSIRRRIRMVVTVLPTGTTPGRPTQLLPTPPTRNTSSRSRRVVPTTTSPISTATGWP